MIMEEMVKFQTTDFAGSQQEVIDSLRHFWRIINKGTISGVDEEVDVLLGGLIKAVDGHGVPQIIFALGLVIATIQEFVAKSASGKDLADEIAKGAKLMGEIYASVAEWGKQQKQQNEEKIILQ